MATADFAPVGHSVQSPFTRGFRVILQWAATRRTARAKKQALLDLLFAPEHLLRDVGISREQLIEKIEAATLR